MSDPPIVLRDTFIVIPTFNERTNVSKLIETIFALYPGINVLVVDDRSPDGTADVVRQMQSTIRDLHLLERTCDPGFAPSYRDGFRLALDHPRCRAILTMDADFSHNPAEIGAMVDKLADCDMVVGSRYTAGGGIANWGLRRRLLSRGANRYVCAILGIAVRDATAGFLCMRREVPGRISLFDTQSNGYAFLVQLKYLLARAGGRIVEHPIVFDERREGQSKMSIGKIWESFWLPWQIRLGRQGSARP